MAKNPFLDKDFLNQLERNSTRELYGRITLLSWDEYPIESLIGKIVNGNINVDGQSSLRRSCSLTLVGTDIDINDFFWGIKNKFILEIGLLNDFNTDYDNIIWFKQGLYIINSFNYSISANNYTINISGKDKMCLVNGDLGGAIRDKTVDFGTYDYYDKDSGISSRISIPIFDIIYEGMQSYGNELPRNIIINDLQDYGFELLDYVGDKPLYMLKNTRSQIYDNFIIDSQQKVYLVNKTTLTETTLGQLNNYEDEIDSKFNPEKVLDVIKLNKDDNNEYVVYKVTKGMMPGYRLTNLTYAGDLLGNAGESFSSILDKIVNMLGVFEYFYDIDGHFVFQRKKNYLQDGWSELSSGHDDDYNINSAPKEEVSYLFKDGQLISTFSNGVNITNLKNDFIVWGMKKTATGSDIPIHMRCAIDSQPLYYASYWQGKAYATEKFYKQYLGNVDNRYNDVNTLIVPWQEIIYQMAIDSKKYNNSTKIDNDADGVYDFNLAIKNSNKVYLPNKDIYYLYPIGITKYEQYYTDIEGFWRQLYVDCYEELTSAWIKNSYVIVNGEYLLYNGDNKQEIIDAVLQKRFYIKDSVFKEVASKVQINNCIGYYYDDEETGEKKKVESKEDYIKGIQYYAKQEVFNEIENISEYINKPYQPNEQGVEANFYVKNNLYYKLVEGKTLSQSINEILNSLKFYNYNGKQIKEEYKKYPENLVFWIDIIESEGTNLERYSIQNIGIRSKIINDDKVKSIYYRSIPNVIFQDSSENLEEKTTGYTYVNIPTEMYKLFTISSMGFSAKEKIDNMLNNSTYMGESLSFTCLPVYGLNPNTKINIEDKKHNISGVYSLDKFSLSFDHKSLMNVNATKLVNNII